MWLRPHRGERVPTLDGVRVRGEAERVGPEGPLLVHAAGNTQAGKNSCKNSYNRLNNKFPSIFFHFVLFLKFHTDF